MLEEEHKSIELKALKVSQPLGEFYIASMPHDILVDITWFDVRRVLMEERDVERYLGVQRPLQKGRVKELETYVNTMDACFPTAVILSVPATCAAFDEDAGILTLRNNVEDPETQVLYRQIAKVLDGQHRLAGLEEFRGERFDVNVAVFVDADLADEATIFSTVNLAQTKVNRSLAYDLYELAKARSPQKACHLITVTLDQTEGSPFYKMVKRLGVATPGRTGETLTQATFIKSLMPFISTDPMKDRDLYLRGKRPNKLPEEQLRRAPFQWLFVDEKDFEIVDVLWNYFQAVSERWPHAWRSREEGLMLNRTNGYRALMRFLKDRYLSLCGPQRSVPSKDEFKRVLESIELNDKDYNVEIFAPGSAGEGRLYRCLVAGGLVE